jgi:hypothetical protein
LGFVGKVQPSLGLACTTNRGKQSLPGWWWFGLGCITGPNKSVKGTRRPLAVLEFGFLSRFGGFVSLSLAARPCHRKVNPLFLIFITAVTAHEILSFKIFKKA